MGIKPEKPKILFEMAEDYRFIAQMKRVTVIGSAGSGKSTLAIKLAALTKLPLYHLDTIFWKPGWVESPKDEFLKAQRMVVAKERWIIDGNYSNSLEIRLERADMVIFLDFSRLVCIWRVIKRILIYRNKNRPDITDGCYERVDIDFLKWVWNFPQRSRMRVINLIEKYQNHLKIIRVHNPSELNKIVSSLERIMT